MTWEERAKIIYVNSKWERKTIESGKLIDNRLNNVQHTGPYGSVSLGGFFDIIQYLAYFDYQVLKVRGLQNKELLALCH